MNQKSFIGLWDHIRQIVGIGIRAVEALPEGQLDAHPIAKMRTPKELAYHQFATLRELLEGLVRGDIKDAEDADAAKIRTKAELLKFCHESWTAANRAAQSVTDEKLTAMVKTPWGRDLPGNVVVVISSDEFLHHRGQLYAFVRALGGEVPEMWDFAHNAEEYRPAQTAKA
ncbi:MAG: DinB family protein [Candidatus Eiseniibacteriota bacterium]